MADVNGSTLTIFRRFHRLQGSQDVDETSPSVTQLTPVDGSVDVGIDARVVMQFDEPINPLSFDPRLLEMPTLNSVSFSSNNTVVSYVPHEPFESQATITVDVPAVEDSAANVVNSASTTFTTRAGLDRFAPTVVSQSPEFRGTVGTNSVLTLRFDEVVQQFEPDSSRIRIRDNTTNLDVPYSLSWDADGRGVTIIPDEALGVGRDFAWTVTGISDMTSNVSSFLFSTNFSTSFEEDAEPPQVLEMSIGDGYEAVSYTHLTLPTIYSV